MDILEYLSNKTVDKYIELLDAQQSKDPNKSYIMHLEESWHALGGLVGDLVHAIAVGEIDRKSTADFMSFMGKWVRVKSDELNEELMKHGDNYFTSALNIRYKAIVCEYLKLSYKLYGKH